MKKTLLSLFIALTATAVSFGQTLNVTGATCADPANNIYIVDPSTDITINIQDAGGNNLAVAWNPTGHLYQQPNQQGQLPAGIPYPLDAYFNSDDPNQTYTYVGDYGTGTVNMTIVTGGFEYHELCYGVSETFDDIDILGIPSANLTWYNNAAGTGTPFAGTDTLVGGTTYYVDLGYPGCTEVFPVMVGYATPVPQGEGAPKFCSAATWESLGISGKTDPILADLGFCTEPGATLTFYDAAGNVIPNSTPLQDGTTYYVTQTVAGCESDQLAIVPDEQFCACSQNARMEDQALLSSAYQVFYQNDPGPITPSVCGVNPADINTLTTFGPLDSTGDEPAVPVSSGWDPAMLVEGTNSVYFPTTSPLKGCSEYAIRMNSPNDATYGSGGTDKAVKVTYDFVAGEVFAFDFAAILRAANHSNSDQPYFKALIIQNGTVIQERCIIANEGGCTFYDLPGAYEPILYSEWSCVKLSTQEITGLPATAVFIVSDCALSGDFGYAYIDNIYVGDNAGANCDGTFGNVFIDASIPDGDSYEACSEVVVPPNPQCAPATEALNPVFPVNITGSYKEPVSTGNNVNLNTIKLSVYQNGQPTPVAVKTGAVIPSPGQYQFTLQQADITNPYGYFSVEVEMTYDLACGQNGQSSSTQTFRTDSKGFKFCPTAGCPPAQNFCNGATGQQSVPLNTTVITDAVLDGEPAADYDISYYNTKNGALNATPGDEITNPAGYSTSVSTTVYIRLEWDPSLSTEPDCFDVVPLVINIGTKPTVPATLPPIGSIGCVDAAGDGNFDLTQVYTAVTASVNPSDVTVTYHSSQNNADLGINPILPPLDANYPGTNGDTIFVRTENNVDGCYDITTFDLQGNQLLYNAPTTLTVCDQDTDPTDAVTPVNLSDVSAQIDGNGTYTVDMTYYLNQSDAQNATVGADLPTTGYNTGDVASVWVRIEDPNDALCFKVEEFAIDVVPAPEVFDQSLFGCSGGGGGATFDLTSQTLLDAITGTAAGVSVASFHYTLAEANSNTNPIPTAQLPNYPSTGGDVFARVSDGNCHNVATVSLTVGAGPNLVPTGTATYELCDDGTGTMEFDLTSMKDDIINDTNVSGYTVTYYATQADIPGNPITTNETNYPSTGTTIIAVVEIGGCAAQTTFDLVVNPLPTFNPPADLVECDQGAQDGETTFDLNDATAQIAGGNTNLTITYYATPTEADAGVAGTELVSPYSSPDGTIYVRVEDNSTTTVCYDTATLQLDVIPAPTVTAPPAYEVCDGDDGNIDGSATFNLPSLNAVVSNNATGVMVTYHPDQAAADAGTPMVTTPANFNSPSGSVFARVEETSGAGCYNTVEVILTVLESPLPPASITPLEACDPDGNNQESFDLTEAEVDIRLNEPGSASAPWTITYYATKADRAAGGPAVPDETDFTNNAATPTQAVFFRITGANGCTTDGQFDVVVNSLPDVNTPEPRIICDDGTADGIAEFDLNNATTQITGNNANFTVTYYEDQADADAGTAGTEIPSTDWSTYENDTPYNDSVWIRIVDNLTTCVVVLEVPLEVEVAPTANIPADYEVCDPDNDGKHVFNLPTLDQEITGGVAGVTVTYHETLANAENGVIDITTPGAFANTVNNTQTIYARVQSQAVDCYVVVPVVLVVNPSPQPVLPQNLPALTGCDENGDGQYQFDLTEMADDIKANEANPADFTLEYYATQGDIPANPIGTPSGHLSGSGTIYVVVTGPNDCTKETRFELIVNPLPVVTTPQPLELCDVNNPGDEKEEFDLTEATMDITMGDASINISYWQTQTAADTGDTNSSDYIGTPTAYTNEVNNETIYIRAVDTDTGCTVTQGYTLTLIVNPLPSPELPTESFKICDADNDGFVEFDLEEIIPVIQNGEPDVEISFYIGLNGANSGVGAIDFTQPFQLTSNGIQTLFVRAENTLTGCYVTGPITLEVVSSPEIINLEDIYMCDDDTPNGFTAFDLTVNTPKILGTQDATDLEVNYYITQQDAENGTNAIDVPSAYTNISNPQTIYVRIENTETLCIDTFDFTDDNSFQLYVEELPVVNDPTPLAICDDDYGTDPVEQTLFDLTVKEGEIAGQTVPPSDYEFTYYASQQDFQNGVSITDPTAYQNVENPQTIYITVVNGDTNNLCEDYTTLTITVQPLPSPSETDQDVLRLEQCDDDNDGVAALPFDLRQSGNLIAGGENVELHYYKTERAAKEGDTNSAEYITTPDAYTNEPSYNTINSQGMEVQVIYVRVESGAAGNSCFVLTQFEIRVIPAPVLNDIEPFGYTLCEDGSSGSAALFTEDIARNLYDASVASPDPSVIVPLLDQIENTDLELDNYTINYYLDAAGTTPFVSGTTVSTGDSVFVQVEYDETGCTSLIAEIIITVEPRPVIPGTDLIREVCSDEPGGTTATIDLTQFDVDVNPGAPADTEVVYYENINAYNNGDAPIDVPTAYTTIENPQEIIGVVRDVNTLCESLDYSTILIEVNSSPMVDLSMYDGMVICRDLDPFTPTIGGNYDPIVLETGLSETDYTFEWSLDGTVLAEDGPSLLVTEAGTYSVTVTDVSSSVNTFCTTTASATIIESNPPEFTVEVLTESFNETHTITIGNVTGAGDYEFRVDQGPWMELGEDGTLTFTGIGAGTHTVYGRDKNGCGTTAIDASIIDYPKFFTPNADGYNDTWNIIGIENQPDAKIYIFDRYGKLLKQLSPTGPGWDGTFNGRPMPSSDYWFRVEYIEPKTDTPATFKANFTLKR